MELGAPSVAITTIRALALTLAERRGVVVACMPRHLLGIQLGCLTAALLRVLATVLFASLAAASWVARARVVAGVVAMARFAVGAVATLAGIVTTRVTTFPALAPMITPPRSGALGAAALLACALGRAWTLVLAFPVTLAPSPVTLAPSPLALALFASLPLLVSAMPAVM